MCDFKVRLHFLSARFGLPRTYCNDTEFLFVYVYTTLSYGGGELNMVKISQDHFQAILSIFHLFFAHIELASPC